MKFIHNSLFRHHVMIARRWYWTWTRTWIHSTTTTTVQMIMCSSIVVAAE